MANYLPAQLGQNYIDYIMKQYQVWIDTIFGSENDNSNESAVDPATFSGLTGAQIYTAWAEGVSVGFYADVSTIVNIGKDNNGNVVSDYTVLSEYTGNYAYLNAPLRSYFNSSNYFCEMWGGYKRSQIISNSTWYFRSLELGSEEVNANYVITDHRSGQDYSEHPWLSPGTLRINENGGLTGDRFLLGKTNYVPYAGNLGTPVLNIPSFSNLTEVTNVDSTTNNYHTTTYTTNEGDTINIRYNEYSVNLGSSGFEMSYDDVYNIFADIILPNIPQGNTLVVPTYDDVKYQDMGDFYIEPLHQYDKIPVAPAFDGTIDLADYPTVLAEGANTFLDFMPATLSALFTAAFVACVVIRKLGR